MELNYLPNIAVVGKENQAVEVICKDRQIGSIILQSQVEDIESIITIIKMNPLKLRLLQRIFIRIAKMNQNGGSKLRKQEREPRSLVKML
ncbi:unnamed protein product (macronuclear) [Paramecium tetraurelia]|uniref:Uncharacterized protein n=1 Tax=Paramecium tetraurelia TaxID=5888 RepID=A0DLB4_PARTE|nr:uncharacterized protein GSPATT00018148001 [Paramecium tetraurelia]CAK83831.1 unnamed protein product [Paramecium tetraurelia]|eukprot:XP_001451228.1 hypothetical protein (macronuclear) [Paramecium tetraurelia strain d4-2]